MVARPVRAAVVVVPSAMAEVPVQPKVSIVIPVLNEGEVIAENLKNLRKRCGNSCEIMVVDGGSTDATAMIAAPLADQLIYAERGRALQMNAGAEKAEGDYLLFLHADTLLPESFLELVKRWDENKVVWGFFCVRLSGKHWLLRWVERGINVRSRLSGIATGDQCLFVRRDRFLQAGGFPRQLLMEDIELCKQLKKIAPATCISERVTTSSRRWEQRGVTQTILQMWWFRLQYFFGVSPERLCQKYYPNLPRSHLPISHRYNNTVIIQFAKTPELGQVKTRLRSALDDSGCLSLHKALVEHQFLSQRLAAVAPRELWASNAEDTEYFTRMIGGGRERLAIQRGEDLGERMSHCFESRLKQYPNVILIGSDCPALNGDYIVSAIEKLEEGMDAVIGPAADGGYVLIALRRFDSRLFDSVPWGTDQVLSITENKLIELGWHWSRLAVLPDIDRPEDLEHLARFPGLGGVLIQS